MEEEKGKKFRILVLDGGGSKGIYSIGILKELEKKLGGRLFEHFDLIYGTSTGSIIGSLIALGEEVQTIEKLYCDLIPKIMGGFSREEKSQILKEEADKVYKELSFDAFKTDIGIVSTNYDEAKPFIFKSNIKFAHGLKHSFISGFGCSISVAVQASCSAFPIFDIRKVETKNQGIVNAVDGGYIANNATLFALIDAHKAFNIREEDIRLLSIGVGKYIEKPINWKYRLLGLIKATKFVEKILSANTNTNEVLAKLLFKDLNIVRVNETFNEPEFGTNMVETDEKKLQKLLQLGRGSFAKFEKDIEQLF